MTVKALVAPVKLALGGTVKVRPYKCNPQPFVVVAFGGSYVSVVIGSAISERVIVDNFVVYLFWFLWINCTDYKPLCN